MCMDVSDPAVLLFRSRCRGRARKGIANPSTLTGCARRRWVYDGRGDRRKGRERVTSESRGRGRRVWTKYYTRDERKKKYIITKENKKTTRGVPNEPCRLRATDRVSYSYGRRKVKSSTFAKRLHRPFVPPPPGRG